MAKKQVVQAVFKARDDSEHPSAKLAEKHNAVLDAADAFNEAAKNVNRCLMEAAATADGVPFDPRRWNYWCLSENYCGDFPRLYKVNYIPHDASVETDESYGGPRIVLRWYDHDRTQYITVRIAELYADEGKARAAYIAACEKRFAEHKEQLEKIKAAKRGPHA